MQPKILLACNGNFLAHVSRVLLIGRELQKRGCKIIYAASGDSMQYVPLLTEAPVVPLWTEPKADTMAFARGDAEAMLHVPYNTNVEQARISDEKTVMALAPDLVVGDFRWTMGPTCKVLAMPYVSVTNAAWTKYYAHPKTSIDAADYWGVPYGMNLFDVIEGDLTLIADLPTFAPMVGQPASVQYIGPMLWDGDCEWSDQGWPALKKATRNDWIYVTMGSSGNDVTYGRVLSVLSEQSRPVFITGKPVTPDFPEHFYFAERMPGLRMCNAADVVICHGGNGTIYQAIRGGCPIIGIPNTVEQRVHMQRVQQLKLGVSLEETFSDAQLLREIQTAIDPNPYSEHLWEIGAGMEPHPQAAEMKAADAILKLLG